MTSLLNLLMLFTPYNHFKTIPSQDTRNGLRMKLRHDKVQTHKFEKWMGNVNGCKRRIPMIPKCAFPIWELVQSGNPHSLVTFRTKFNLDQILWNWMISNLLDNSCWTLQGNEFTKFNPSIGGPNDVQLDVWYCLETFLQRIQINVLRCFDFIDLKKLWAPKFMKQQMNPNFEKWFWNFWRNFHFDVAMTMNYKIL